MKRPHIFNETVQVSGEYFAIPNFPFLPCLASCETEEKKYNPE